MQSLWVHPKGVAGPFAGENPPRVSWGLCRYWFKVSTGAMGVCQHVAVFPLLLSLSLFLPNVTFVRTGEGSQSFPITTNHKGYKIEGRPLWVPDHWFCPKADSPSRMGMHHSPFRATQRLHCKQTWISDCIFKGKWTLKKKTLQFAEIHLTRTLT